MEKGLMTHCQDLPTVSVDWRHRLERDPSPKCSVRCPCG